MSLFTDSSLCLVPSGVKDGKLYSVKPTDGSGDLTFSRGSDIEATRVAANGYIEKAKVNLVLQSNQFDTSWLSSGTTETGGQAGYDGTNDAWLLQRSDGLARFVYQFNAHTGVGTFSVYIKKGNVDWVLLSNGAGENRYFDLTNGVLGATGTAIDSKIESVGGGWFRCSIAVANSSEVRIYPAVGNGTVSGLVGANIYIQDAQLNYGLVAQEYQETTTTSVVSGITNDMPRLDYSGGASCPSLKLEPSRQNLLTNDTYYGGSDWSKIGVSPSANNATSPEGVTNAVLLSETAINDQHSLYPTVSVTSGNAYTASCFVKQGTGSAAPQYIGFRFRGGGFADAGGLVVDLVNKVATYEAGSLTGYKIEDYGNGWLRVSITQSATVTSSSAGLVLFFNNNISGSYSTDYLGNVNADMLVYGAQIEQASYSSSLIPTYGTSATRTQDLSVTASPSTSQFGQTEGTIFTEIEINAITSGSYSRVLNLKNSGGSNQIYIQQNDSKIAGAVFNGSNQFVASTSSGFLSVGSVYKIALAYKNSDYALYINGTQISTGLASGLGTLSVDRLDFTTGAGSIGLGNEVKQSLVFNTRLTNADLATLTA